MLLPHTSMQGPWQTPLTLMLKLFLERRELQWAAAASLTLTSAFLYLQFLVHHFKMSDDANCPAGFCLEEILCFVRSKQGVFTDFRQWRRRLVLALPIQDDIFELGFILFGTMIGRSTYYKFLGGRDWSSILEVRVCWTNVSEVSWRLDHALPMLPIITVSRYAGVRW